MIIRIVRMHFKPEEVEAFYEIFRNSREAILAFEGCEYVELLKDPIAPNILTTYSHWQTVEALNNYRKSELFGKVWPATKALFQEKAVAFSLERIN